jgi:hypothetical protein
MAQSVSHRPLKAEAQVLSRISQCEICGGRSGTGRFFPEFFGFPLSVLQRTRGSLFTMELYCTPKVNTLQLNTASKLLEHTYTSNLYGTGTLIPIGFFQQDLLWQSSNTHSHSCSQRASKHARSIRRRAIVHLHTTTAPRRIVHHYARSSPDDRMSSPSTV